MFSRISQLGKDIENAVTKTDSTLSNAFQTLKSNKDVLNHKTPEAKNLEIVFDANEQNAQSGSRSSETNEARPSSESSDKSMKTTDVEASNFEKSQLEEKGGDSKETEQSKISKFGTVSFADLPKEIQSKLKRLDKYEKKYPGMILIIFDKGINVANIC